MVDPVLAEVTYDKTLELVRKYQRLWPASEKRALIKALYGEKLDGRPAEFGDLWCSTGPDSMMSEILESEDPEMKHYSA